MARMAGMTLHERWSGWKHEPFTSDKHHTRFGLGPLCQPGARLGTGEGFGDRCGWVAEADKNLAVFVAGDVGSGQAEDAAKRLGVKEHEAGGGPDADGGVVVGDVAAH